MQATQCHNYFMDKMRTLLNPIWKFLEDGIHLLWGMLVGYLIFAIAAGLFLLFFAFFGLHQSIIDNEIVLYIVGPCFGTIWGFLLPKIDAKRLALWLLLFATIAHAFVPFGFHELGILIGLPLGIWLQSKLQFECVVSPFPLYKVFLTGITYFCLINLSGPWETHSQEHNQAHEAAAMIARAYSTSTYHLKHKTNAQTGAKDFIPYMDYRAIDTGRDDNFTQQPNTTNPLTVFTKEGWYFAWLDYQESQKLISQGVKGTPLQPCTPRLPCVQLYNGGILQFDNQQTLGGTSPDHAVFFNFDPDGNGPAGRITFYQYSDGKFATGKTKRTQTKTSPTTLTSEGNDPSYWQT